MDAVTALFCLIIGRNVYSVVEITFGECGIGVIAVM